MSRIGNDVNDIDSVVAQTVFGVANNALVAGTTLGLMIAFDWRLTLIALVLIPLIALPMRRAGRRVYEARSATQSKLAELTGYLQEVLGISGALLVKAFVASAPSRRASGGPTTSCAISRSARRSSRAASAR
jgi:ATP-binding cassette, subfamily B, bacterial